MEASHLLRTARSQAHLTLRELAARAHTSHATLAAYEAGRKSPGAATLERVVRAAGFELTASLTPRIGAADPADRGRELLDVLQLAAHFPARHAPTLTAPIFGRPTPRPTSAT